MNKYPSPTEEKVGEECCIICRDTMSMHDSKELPGCGHIFHTSCLREWLVQQQTCPTCRADISVMEARQQRAAVAQPREEQQQFAEENRLRQEALETAEQEAQEQQQAGTGAINPSINVIKISVKDEAKENATKDDSKAEEETEAQLPASMSQALPAFYKVVAPTGALVYQLDNKNMFRTIPKGTAVLCFEKEFHNNLGSMMKIPDGWVYENQMEYMTSVPIVS